MTAATRTAQRAMVFFMTVNGILPGKGSITDETAG
jgi:hypothetical protein